MVLTPQSSLACISERVSHLESAGRPARFMCLGPKASVQHEISHLGLKEAFGTTPASRTALPPIRNGSRTSNSRADQNGLAPRSHCSSPARISHLRLEGTTGTVMHLWFPPLLAQFCTSQEANRARHPERTTSRERWTDPRDQ